MIPEKKLMHCSRSYERDKQNELTLRRSPKLDKKSSIQVRKNARFLVNNAFMMGISIYSNSALTQKHILVKVVFDNESPPQKNWIP